MKRNAIARIVILSIVILLLVSILVMALGLGTYAFRFGSQGEVVIGGCSLPAAEIKDIHIEWASGSISIVRGDTDEIEFVEESNGEEGDSMSYDLSGSTLNIYYSSSKVQLGFVSIPEKHLIITVPKDWDCNTLHIEAAATDVEIRELIIDKLELDCASSDCILSDCNIRQIDLDGASCNFDYSGTLVALECDGASTSITAVLSNTPDSIDIDGASAELDLTLPEDTGFRVEMDGLSNTFSSDFSTTSSDGCYTYGNGHCRIDIDGMSARIRIRNGGHHD